MAVCPTGAITKREEDGIVLIDRDKCRNDPGCGIIAGQTYGTQQAPCKVNCPVHLSASAYLALIANGKFKEALDVIREQVPLPSVIGRICHHPCETVCKRQEVDEPVAICALKRFVSDYVTDSQTTPVPITKKEKVAIIGSGPAGLSAAYYLAKKGYGVTIFEASPEAGGMLTVGIPGFRLPKAVVKRDIDYITGLGVEIRTNTPIGLELSLDDLKYIHGYNAIFIAAGAQLSRKLNVEGIELDGVTGGVDFLRKVNLNESVPVRGKKVVVIGGGNVAVDVAMAALRLGAKEVQVACLECSEEMPAFETETRQMLEEGVKLNVSWGPKRILGDAGRVKNIELIRCTSVFDKKGKFNPSFDKSITTSIDADMVILAIGQAPATHFLEDSGIKCSEGWIATDGATLETSVPGIFAGGDVTGGPGYAINAIAAGKKAAESIDEYLQNLIVILQPITVPIPNAQAIEAIDASKIEVEIPKSVKKQKRQKMLMLPLSKRKGNFDEVARGFTEEAAILEAKRCLNCAGHLCLEACPYGTPQFGAEEYVKMQKCDFCLDRWAEDKKPICVMACPTRALDAGPIEEMMARYGKLQEAVGFTYDEQVKPSVIFRTDYQQ